MPKLRHFDNLGTARFVTFSCFRREPHLAGIRQKVLFVKHLDAARAKHNFKLLGYVLMPEHVHLVLVPDEGMRLGLVVREIKSRMAREFFTNSDIRHQETKVFWQRRCYDHNCRTIESVREKVKYCHNNPVKRGLVSQPDDYEWSSYRWYQGEKNVPITMDEYEF